MTPLPEFPRGTGTERPRRRHSVVFILAICFVLAATLGSARATPVDLRPAGSPEGYVARLLINEVSFPGERSWLSEADSAAAMRQVLFVLDSRLRAIPPAYRQVEIAAVTTKDIIDLITAGGIHGQVEGFYRDELGQPVMVARVHERIDHLAGIALRGAPGRFARLLNHAQALATAWFASRALGEDMFADLRRIDDEPVTGRAYAWMTDLDQYHPGGNYIRITDDLSGGLAGNRFFTLRRLSP